MNLRNLPALAAFALLSPLSTAARPNILWLTSEDHGPEMGCYGDANARTPHVDALAAKGLRFARAWSTHPVCAPARTAIVSGMYATSTGGVHMRSMVPLPLGKKLYPQFLREAGYYCTNNGKEDYNIFKPDGTWDESSAQAHWKKRAAGQPFFAIFNSSKSHESRIRTRPHRAIADPARMRVPAYHPDTPEVRQDWAQYYDKVSEADADAGARLAELADAGLSDDTIVFYYADHGSGMPRGKRWPSNSGLHVPMVVYFPEKWRHLAPGEYRTGGVSDRMVSFVDLAPTVLSIVGLRPPEWMQGHAFAGPHQEAPPPYLFGSRGRMDERDDTVRSLTDGRYVYLRNYQPHVSQAQRVGYQFQTPTTRIWHDWWVQGRANTAQSLFWQTPKAPEELYDLQNDPDEVRNLAGSSAHRAVLEKLRGALRTHLEAIRDVCFLPEGEMHARAQGSTPYDMARDDSKYPLRRIIDAAELASGLDPAAIPELTTRLGDADSAVRYWAAMGFLMRGGDAVLKGQAVLRRALSDPSPYVRIVAARALIQFAPEAQHAEALTVLREFASAEKHGALVAVPALAAIEALGPKAASLREYVGTLKPTGAAPHPRFNSYPGRLMQHIAPQASGGRPKR